MSSVRLKELFLKAKVCAKSIGQRLSQACPGKKCGYVNDHPDMTIAVDWDVKHQIKQTKSLCMLSCCLLVFVYQN